MSDPPMRSAPSLLRWAGPLVLSGVMVTTATGQRAQPQPGDALAARAERLLQATPVIDGHNDLPWQVHELAQGDLGRLDIGHPQPSVMTDIARLRAGGVGGQFWSVYVPV